MKQILLVLLFTGLVVVGFVVARLLSEDAGPGPGVRQDPGRGTGAITAPTGQRPDIGGAQLPAGGGDEGAVSGELRPDVAEKLAARAAVDWKEGLAPETSVEPDEAWWPLTEPVDYDADVVVKVGDVEITRDRFRSYVCLRHGRPLLRAKLMHTMVLDDASRSAPDFALPPGAFDKAFEARARMNGRTLEEERNVLTFSGQMSPQASYEARRLLFESVALALLPRALEGDLPPVVALPLSADGARGDQILASIGEVWAAVSDGEATDEEWNGLWSAVDLLGLHWSLSFEESVATLTWTALDLPLPEGVVAQVATGVQAEEVGTRAPWLLSGVPVPVQLDELWSLLEPGLDEGELELDLREIVWFDAISEELAREGVLPAPESAWQSYYDELIASRETALPFSFYKLELLGFPGLAQYRQHERLREGFAATEAGALPTEEELLAHYRANRTLFAGFEPSLEYAFFPSHSPLREEDGFDRERARQAAAEFADRARVPGADFSQLSAAHQSELRDAYGELPRELPRVQRFNSRYATGEVRGSLREVDKRLGLTHWELEVRTSSVARSALVELVPGQVSDPWPVTDGWLVVHLDDARLLQLEPAFEDVRAFVERGLADDRFRLWANGLLKR